MKFRLTVAGATPDPIVQAGSDRLQRILAQQKAEAVNGLLARLPVQTSDHQPPERAHQLYPNNIYRSSDE